jgi:hypothetical protein
VRALDDGDEGLAGASVLEHPAEPFVHDVPHASDEHRDERFEVSWHALRDEVLQGDVVHHLVGEVGGERLVHLRVEQRLVDRLGDLLGAEHRLVGPDGDHAGEHADDTDDPEQDCQDRSGDPPRAPPGGLSGHHGTVPPGSGVRITQPG